MAPRMMLARSGDWKMLVGKRKGRIELFRFPADRLESFDVAATQRDEVEHLKSLIDAWKKTIPTEANQDCCSKQRNK